MKKITRFTLPALSVLIILLTSCKSENDTVVEKQIAIDKSHITLSVGESELIKAFVSPDGTTDTELQWKSSNPRIATVDNGNVTAISGGTATVTVTITENGNTANCAITVNKDINNEGTIVNWK